MAKICTTFFKSNDSSKTYPCHSCSFICPDANGIMANTEFIKESYNLVKETYQKMQDVFCDILKE